MLLEHLKGHGDFVKDYEVEQFRKEPSSYQLLATVVFSDHSQLHLKDYLFRDGSRKYAYHWQNSAEEIIIRWDNAPHWNEIDTYPHHKHVEKPNNVKASEVRSIGDVFDVIRNHI